MTKEEKKWLRDISELGCIVCLQGGVYSPPEIHHILSGGRKQSDLETIPLCMLHHRGMSNNSVYTSRHNFKRAFEKRYGYEKNLLAETRRLCGRVADSDPGEKIQQDTDIPV